MRLNYCQPKTSYLLSTETSVLMSSSYSKAIQSLSMILAVAFVLELFASFSMCLKFYLWYGTSWCFVQVIAYDPCSPVL